MKQQEMRKIEEQKQKDKNINFLIHLKQSRSIPEKTPPSPVRLVPTHQMESKESEAKRRSPRK